MEYFAKLEIYAASVDLYGYSSLQSGSSSALSFQWNAILSRVF